MHMANLALVGITSASLSFMAVVGVSTLMTGESHAQNQIAGTAISTEAPDARITSTIEPAPEKQIILQQLPPGAENGASMFERPAYDRSLRALAIEQLQLKLGEELRDGIAAQHVQSAIPQRPANQQPEPAAKPKRLPRII